MKIIAIIPASEADHIVQRRIATVTGVGTGQVRIRVRISGTKTVEGSAGARVFFDSTDELNHSPERVSFAADPTSSGPFNELIEIKGEFGFNTESPTPVYLETKAEGSKGGNATLAVLQVTVAPGPCE